MSEELRNEAEVDAELLDAPTERDRAIYEAVCIHCRPAGEVGEEMRLAATTVRNIALDVQRKMARRLHRLERMTTADSLKAYHDRLTAQLGQVSGAWAASRQAVETEHKISSAEGEEKTVVAVKKQRGDARFMNLSTKISREMHLIEAQFQAFREKEARRAERERIPADDRRRLKIIQQQEDRNLAFQVQRSGSIGRVPHPALAVADLPEPNSRPLTLGAHDVEEVIRRAQALLARDKTASQTRPASDVPQVAAEQRLAAAPAKPGGRGGG